MAKNHITMREKLCYGAGNLGINLQFGMVSAFLMYFYTDVYGITPAVAAQLFLIARTIDAIFDPFMGFLIDRTETRWGKHRPYLAVLAIPYAICGVTLFFAPPIYGALKLIYVYATYTVFGILYSALSLPLLSMLPTISRDTKERTVINAVREFLAAIAFVGVGYLTLPLVAFFGGGSRQQGFWMTAALFGVITLAGLALLVTNTREREPPIQTTRLTTGQSLRTVVGNWPWIATSLLNLFYWIGLTVHIQSAVYFAEYSIGQLNLLPDLMLTMTGSIAGVAATGWVANRIGKRATGYAGAALAAAATAATPLSHSPAWLIGTSIGTYFGLGLIGGLIFAMMADAVDYGEWRTGHRAQGFLYAASSLGVKLGMGIGGAIGGALLAYSGYAKDAPVTEAVKWAIDLGYIWVPVACITASGLCFFLFVFESDFEAHATASSKDNQTSTA